DFGPSHAENRAIQVDVLPACKVIMKSRPDLQERCNEAANTRLSPSGFGDPAQNFQERALAGPIAANDADGFAGLNGKRHIFKRSEFGAPAAFLGLFFSITREELLHLFSHGLCIELPQRVAFGEIFDLDYRMRHEG